MTSTTNQYQFIRVTAEEAVATVMLDRPEKLNAWHAPMRQEVTDALAALEEDETCRAIILTGAGDRAFGAGQDLAEAKEFDADRAGEWMEEWKRLYASIRDLTKPIVAAVNGVAAGSAFQVTLLCDLRIGHKGTRMGQPEIDAGIPSVTGTWLLWEMLGPARAKDLILTGRLLDGGEAHHMGLLNRLVDESRLMDEAQTLAAELAAKPPVAMRLNKRRFREVGETAFSDAEQAGKRIHAEALATGEPQATMRRFFEARRG